MPKQTHSLYFVAPGKVAVENETLASPASHELQVAVEYSGISAGTEMLFYRGNVPAHMAIDSSLEDFSQTPTYPMRYGYATVGQVVQTGDACDPAWLGRRVFAFQPHGSHYNSAPANLLALPDDVPAQAGVLFPNVETAVSLAHDAAPRIGERVLIFGQGIVGLLSTWLFAQLQLEQLWVVDPIVQRRQLALRLGAQNALPPAATDLDAYDPDLILELTGNPAALSRAVEVAGYHSRIIVGSWYGNKQVDLPLGHEFHRNRVTIYSSQVSTLPAELSARWDKARRYATAWRILAHTPYAQLISHRYPFAKAAEAYRHIDTDPASTVQVLLEYPREAIEAPRD